MAEFSRTWWGQKFITAIESFTDSARLGRGRSYARGGKILDFKMNKGKIEATISPVKVKLIKAESLAQSGLMSNKN